MKLTILYHILAIPSIGGLIIFAIINSSDFFITTVCLVAVFILCIIGLKLSSGEIKKEDPLGKFY